VEVVAMGVMVSGVAPEKSMLAWYDEHLVDDVALYDITRQAATVLSAMLLQRGHAVANGLDEQHWEARRRLVKR
jgi:hypothetical protein